MSENILHITTRDAWVDAQKAGNYVAVSLATEGFIHCSTSTQVLSVAEKFYKGQSGLVLLVIDPARLTADVKWEAPSDGAPPAGKTPAPPPGVDHAEQFPHIYGPINLDAVVKVLDFEPGADGKFILPPLP